MKKKFYQTVDFATPHSSVATSRKPAFQLEAGAAGLKWPDLKLGWIVGFVCLLLMAMSAQAKIWYVDNTASGSNNGTSWANAWTSVKSVAGVAGGDTVYISGGSTSQTYTGVSNWSPRGGSSGNPVIYAVGQTSGKNGVVVFDGGGASVFLTSPLNWVTLNGNVSGSRNMTIQHYGVTIAASGNAGGSGDGGITFSYLNVYQSCSMIRNPVPYEFDHNFFNPLEGSDHCISFGGDANPTGFDSNLIHDNIFYAYRDAGGSGAGDDCIQWGNSVSVYNNYFKGIPTTYTGSQHQDGWQMSGQYTKCYNNTFENMANSCVYVDFTGDIDSIYLFNNVGFISDPALNGYPRGYDIAADNGVTGIQASNIWVFNNTFADYPNFFGIKFGAVSPQPVTYTNCHSCNNLCYNAGYICDSGVSQADNIAPTTGGSTYFVSYALYSASNNFHLTSAFTAAIAQGTNLPASISTTDKDGNPRPSGAWSIGAYQYGANTPPAPQNLRIQSR